MLTWFPKVSYWGGGRRLGSTECPCHLCTKPINAYRSQPRPRPQSQGRGPTTQPPNPKSAIPRQRAQRGERCQPPTPRAQSHANERNKRGRSPHPHHTHQGRRPTTQPQERNPTLTTATRGEMPTPTPRAQSHPNEWNQPTQTHAKEPRPIHICPHPAHHDNPTRPIPANK